LNRDSPDATIGAGDQHAFAQHQAGDFERPQSGHSGCWQRGGLRVGYLVGDHR
jgi:hypothetical protein